MEFTYNHLPLHQQHHATFQPSPDYFKTRETTHDPAIPSLATQQTSAAASAPLVEETILHHNTAAHTLGSFLGSSPMPASSPSSLYDEQQQLLQQQMRREHMLLSQQHLPTSVAHGNHFLAAPGRIAPTRSMSFSCYAGDVLSEQMLSQQQQLHPHHSHYHQQHQQQLQRRSMSISVYPTTAFTHSPSANVSALHGPGLSASPAPATGTPFSSMASSPALSPMSMAGSPVPPMGAEWELMQQQQQQQSHDQSMAGFHGFGSPTSPSAGMHQLSLSPKHITPHPFASYTFPPIQDQQESLLQHQPKSAATATGVIGKGGATRSRKPSRSAAAPTKSHHQRQPTPLMLTARLPSPLSSQPSSPITSATGFVSANASRHRKSSLSISSSSSLSSTCSSSSSPSMSSGTTSKPPSVPNTPSSPSSSSATPTTTASAPEVHACLECDMTFAGPAVLLRHQESIHKKIAWCCMGCGSRLCRRDAVTRHMNLSPTGSVCRQVGEIGQLNKVGEEYVVVERNPYIAKPLRVVLTKMGKRLPPGLLDEEEENSGAHQGDTTALSTSAMAPAVIVSPDVGSLVGAVPIGTMPPSLMMISGSDGEVNYHHHHNNHHHHHHHHMNNNTNHAATPSHSRKRSSPGDEQPLYSLTDAASPDAFSALKPDRKQRKQKGN
ncbi:hypothetical protein DFQ27_007657 [Actinomortierella ambigua]|uniref:C2H2-type domain-containing protein n=1 Tax=Actinomortierella ambigua TaxID=1343610 RepID=A0A9P6PU70_9FUNG|nr:hypothetical protein DFQ27_007657 [Actinomortierella ambigua]